MTEFAKLYGGSLYDLAAEEGLEDRILGELDEAVGLFGANPDYLRLLATPSIPKKEALLAYLAPEDPRRAEMLEQLTEEMVVIAEDHYSICYPLGSLPGEEQSCRLSSALPEGLLHPWAVPIGPEQEAQS